jgi:hypothetical protein
MCRGCTAIADNWVPPSGFASKTAHGRGCGSRSPLVRSLPLSMASLVSRDRAEACQRPGGTGHDVQGTYSMGGFDCGRKYYPTRTRKIVSHVAGLLDGSPCGSPFLATEPASVLRPGKVLQYCKKSPVLDLKSVNEYKPRVFLQHPSGRSSSCGQTKLVMHANITRHKPASRVTRRHRPDALGGRTAVSSIR